MVAWKFVAVLALCTMACDEARAAAPAPHPARTARAVPVALHGRTPHGRVLSCANLAAMRALDAKAKGASYPAQDRLLKVTFVFCMTGAAIEG
ncbi:MAG: hypothetical protein JSR60_13735 [Proteobacteria bacterium]|nr:hypothetical protein [Pseudomonadota bacterium]